MYTHNHYDNIKQLYTETQSIEVYISSAVH